LGLNWIKLTKVGTTSFRLLSLYPVILSGKCVVGLTIGVAVLYVLGHGRWVFSWRFC